MITNSPTDKSTKSTIFKAGSIIEKLVVVPSFLYFVASGIIAMIIIFMMFLFRKRYNRRHLGSFSTLIPHSHTLSSFDIMQNLSLKNDEIENTSPETKNIEDTKLGATQTVTSYVQKDIMKDNHETDTTLKPVCNEDSQHRNSGNSELTLFNNLKTNIQHDANLYTTRTNESSNKFQNHSLPPQSRSGTLTLTDLESDSLYIPVYLATEYHCYRLGEEIGNGGFSNIYDCQTLESSLTQRTNSQRVVAKVVKEEKQIFEQEVSIIALANRTCCNHFVSIIGYDLEKTTMLLLFCNHGTLKTWIFNDESKPIGLVTYILRAIAEAINILHQYSIVHNDIKPDNVLIHKDIYGALVPKISDFGISTIVHNTALKVQEFRVQNRRGFSYAYTAPERY